MALSVIIRSKFAMLKTLCTGRHLPGKRVNDIIFKEGTNMDPVHFTGKEIIDMAVRIEENGLKFYTDAFKASESNAVRELFKVLADEEGQHIKTFLTIKKSLADDNDGGGFDAYADEASAYLKALADTEVFTSPEGGRKAAVNMHDAGDVIEMAIGMEKDALLFYYELQRMIREKDRHVLESIIEQEKEHLRKLTELQNAFGN